MDPPAQAAGSGPARPDDDQTVRSAEPGPEPARYTGRTRHYHVKVQAAKGPVLTTQLYFPGEPGNARDPLFQRSLLMVVSRDGSERIARFDFVIARG